MEISGKSTPKLLAILPSLSVRHPQEIEALFSNVELMNSG